MFALRHGAGGGNRLYTVADLDSRGVARGHPARSVTVCRIGACPDRADSWKCACWFVAGRWHVGMLLGDDLNVEFLPAVIPVAAVCQGTAIDDFTPRSGDLRQGAAPECAVSRPCAGSSRKFWYQAAADIHHPGHFQLALRPSARSCRWRQGVGVPGRRSFPSRVTMRFAPALLGPCGLSKRTRRS